MRSRFSWHAHRRSTLAGAGIALIVATVLPTPAAAQESQPTACAAAVSSSWTPQEAWVWKQLCARQEANLNTSGRFGPPTDIAKPESWAPKRVLRSRFIEAILTEARYSELLVNRSIKISGAWFPGPINLENSSLAASVYLWSSRFDGRVNLLGANVSGTIAFDGSALRDQLSLEGAKVDGNVFLRNGARFGRVDMTAAQVGIDVDASNATFTDVLDLAAAKVDSNVFLNNGAQFKGVDLVSSQIGQSVVAVKSTFTDVLNLNAAKVEGNVFLSGGAQFQGVNLVDSQISGGVLAHGSTFRADFELDRAQVKGSVLLYGSQFAGAVDFSGATIEGGLALSGGGQNPTWQDSAEINLEGANVRVVDDAAGGWPKHVRLAGFVMQQSHGQMTEPGQGIIDRATAWYLDWLDRDRGFSRESYKHLEVLLRDNGRTEIADAIAVARMDHEYASQGNLRKVVGVLHRYTVGYGYQPELAIVWIILLIVIGAIVAGSLPESTLNNAPSRFVLSAQRLIPLIDFGTNYKEANVTGTGVEPWVRGYFYFHAIAGYILAAFLVAALARVTTT